MKALRLFKALSMVDEKWVEEAWDYRPPSRKHRPALYGLAAAACCTLFCAFGFFYLVTGGFHGFGSAAPEESPAESTAEGAEVSEDVAADNGSGGVSYLSYAGPVLPLTVLEQDTFITAAREVTWDVSSDQSTARYEDAYTLTNPTAQAVTVTALYPFAGNFRDLTDQQPTITVDGQAVTPQLHPGTYAGSFTGTGDGHPGTYNLLQPSSWEDYAALLEDGSYASAALAGLNLPQTPVVVYDFSDLSTPSPDQDLVVSCSYDSGATTLLSYDFNGGNWDETNTWRQYGGRAAADGCPTLIVVGEDITSYSLLDGYGLDAPELHGVTGQVVRRETTLSQALEELCSAYLSNQLPGEEAWADTLSLSDFTAAAAQLLTDYGPLSQAPVERYADGRLDELIAEAGVVSRVFYLSFPVTIPADGSVTVTAAGRKSASFDFPGTGGPYEGTQSYELAPTLGSSLAFTGQTARLLRDDDTVLTRDDYGFSATGEAVSLDGRPCYAFTVQ
ncbi:MAG: hypothetical protein ACOX7M_05505 [Dysosmobacter sp.]|jgi:hypothetical protein|uniref:hypothetical protein n=1 Tax=Dysosmobacter sp. TaxID=2591382 RepID=UPI003D8DF9B2